MQKTILISGVARGIGRYLVHELLKRDYFVIGLTRSEDSKNELIDTLKGQGFKYFEIINCDIANQEALYYLGQKLKTITNSIDVLINNAGLGIGGGLLKDQSVEYIYSVFNVNFFGAWRLYQTVDSLLFEGSKVINVSSSMGLSTDLEQGGYPVYRLSKWALNGFSIQLGAELKSRDINVYAVCPGWTQTDMGGEGAPNTIDQGADTILWLTENAGIDNGFYRDRKKREW